MRGRSGRPAWREAASFVLAVVLALGVAIVVASDARAQTCSRSDFEGVVAEAASALRDLNLKNKPPYQAKLRQLKDKRGWDQDTFMKEAMPLVQDEKIVAFDQRSGDLLSQINTMGQVGSADGAADCELLAKLRGLMTALVETQKEKWAYMFARVDAELAK